MQWGVTHTHTSQYKSACLEEKKKSGIEKDALFSAYATSGPVGRKPA